MRHATNRSRRLTGRHGVDRRRGGFSLLLTVMLLLMLAALALSGLNTVQRDQQTAGVANRKRIALQAADAGAAKAFETMSQTGTPTIPTTALGDAALYPHGLPSFSVDTTAADPTELITTGGVPGMNLQPNQSGVVPFVSQFWRVRVQGNAPGGTVARVEFVTSSVVAN
jgi:Tfp pilus assembly protein PilX